MNKKQILEKLERREFQRRCRNAIMCFKCGHDLMNVAPMVSHCIDIRCINEKCSQCNKITRSIIKNS